ncbi:MAG: response regulator transcription factor [Clostridiales bacterium]|nr:response regulator transcription factor [Clostridiales bacterium]
MRIVIVDDDKLVCTSLKIILEQDDEISIVGIGHNGKEAVKLYHSLKPDILLLDIRMDTMTGLEAAEIILGTDKDAKILFLTTFSDHEYIVTALRIGSKGYIIKQNFESIAPALKAVHMGQSVFGDDIVSKIPSLIPNNGNTQNNVNLSIFGLTEREAELVSLVAEGLNNKEIASRLFLSEGTVRNTITTILEKLELRDRTQLAIFYYKNK